MICYEKKAEAFRRAWEASGGDLIRALREADRSTFVGRASALTDEQKAEMRRERAEQGTKVEVLAEKFGVSVATASKTCRGVQKASSQSLQGERIICRIGAEQSLPAGWERPVPRLRKVPRQQQVAQRACVLAMSRLGLTQRAIGRLIGMTHLQVSRAIPVARGDFEAVLLADWALLNDAPAAAPAASPAPRLQLDAA